ncbi:unnamed protein product, partial [Bubo scandiacus]
KRGLENALWENEMTSGGFFHAQKDATEEHDVEREQLTELKRCQAMIYRPGLPEMCSSPASVSCQVIH